MPITINSKFVKFNYVKYRTVEGQGPQPCVRKDIAEILAAIVNYGAIAFISGYDNKLPWPTGKATEYMPNPEILSGNVIFAQGKWFGTSKDSLEAALGDSKIIEKLGKGSLVTDQNPKTLATADNIGQIIYLTTQVIDREDTYSPGPYIVSGDGTVSKIDTTIVEVVQSTGTSTTAVMSQKAVSDALSTKANKTELDSYATKEYVQTNAPQETKESIEEKLGAWLEDDGGESEGEVYTKAESDALLSGKVDKTDIVQSTGTSETAVMSQKAVSDELSEMDGKVDELEAEVIYDVTANNDGVTFDSLSALLSDENLSTLIPPSVRHGGMSIRFIQGSVPSSDNKYMQYRLMATSFSTDEDDWQGVDDEPTVGSDNLVKSGGVANSISNVKHGNLIKTSSGSEVTINLSDTLYVDNLISYSNKTAFEQVRNFRVHYFQVTNSILKYKLGSANVSAHYALVISDNVPSVGVAYTNGVVRVADAEGQISISGSKYVCVCVYVGAPSYYPQSLVVQNTIETSVNIFTMLGDKSQDSSIESTDVWGAIEEVKADIHEPTISEKKIPFLIESASYFWMRKQATNFNQNNPFKISASANSATLTVLSGGESTSVLASDDEQAAIVIKHDDGHCTPHILLSWDSDTLTIFPAVEDAITDGELVPLLADSQHLTKYGFHAWSEHLYNANPRYCEKNKYIARYAPVDTYQAPPFTQIGGNLILYPGRRNDNNNWCMQYGKGCAFYYPSADKSDIGEYGVKWSIDTGDKTGYLESMIGTMYDNSYYPTPSLTKDSGYEMHIEVYADNMKIYDYLKTTNHVERICVPYSSEQRVIELKVYYTKLRAHQDSISIGATTLWVNEQHTFSEKMFPNNSIVSWFMASWGEYSGIERVTVNSGLNGYPEFPVASEHQGTADMNYKEYSQGASGEAMRELISKASGIQVPAYIRSKAGATTRFGKAWWHFLVKPYNPNIMVTSFGVNDYHTNTNPGAFLDVLDPYGNNIDMSTPILPVEYADNIKQMIDMCHMNGITFVHAEGSIAQSFDWLIALENNLSTQVAI